MEEEYWFVTDKESFNEFIKTWMKKSIVLCAISMKNSKNPKISYIFNETLVLSIIYSKFDNNNDRIFKQKESI